MKSTKNKLLSSIATLCVCFAMLIGSTYAWFTDSASTGVNKIQSGNLDVQLLVHNGADYVDVEQNPDNPLSLFDMGTSNVAQNNNQDTLWEPGKTQVAYLQIKNKGNLDLKYSVVVEVVNPSDSKNLYEVMKYNIVRDATPSNTVTTWTEPGKSITEGNNATEEVDVQLNKGAERDFALVIHMDEAAGNTYKDGKVEFYIHVHAAQLTSESDSFGPNYDANAKYPVKLNARVSVGDGNTVTKEVTVSTAEKVSETEGPVATVTIPAGVIMEDGKSTITTSITPTSTPSTMTGNISVTSDSKTFEVKADGVDSTNNTPLTVEAYIGKGLSSVKLYHNGTLMTENNTGSLTDQQYSYTSSTGYVTFASTTFSPFTATYDKESWDQHAAANITEENNVFSINTAEELAKFAKMVNEEGNTFAGKTVRLEANIDLGKYLWKPVGQTGGYSAKTYFQGTFDGNGKSISNLQISDGSWEAGSNAGQNYATGFFGFIDMPGITIQDVTFKNAIVNGHHWVGVAAGYMTGTASNITVINSTVVSTNKTSEADGDKAGGVVGYLNNGSVTNCSVNGTSVTAVRDCGSVVGNSNGSVTDNTASDCNVYYSTDNAEQIGGEIAGKRASGVSNNTATNVTVQKITTN